MSLLLNKYPISFIRQQLERVPQKLQCTVPSRKNYSEMRKIFLAAADNSERKARIDFEVNVLCHFSFCKGIHDFSTRFYRLWEDCFADTAICNMKPIVGSRRLDNLHEYLVNRKPNRSLLKICNLPILRRDDLPGTQSRSDPSPREDLMVTEQGNSDRPTAWPQLASSSSSSSLARPLRPHSKTFLCVFLREV